LMGPLHDQLKTLLAAETVDLAAVRAKIEEIGRIHVELRMVQIQEHLEFQTILTPAQKTKFQDMMRQRMEHRPGPGPGPRPNPNNRPNNNRPNQPHH